MKTNRQKISKLICSEGSKRRKMWMTVQKGSICAKKSEESAFFQFSLCMNKNDVIQAKQLMDKINDSSSELETRNRALIELMQVIIKLGDAESVDMVCRSVKDFHKSFH